jgi:hypothetical protein
LQRTDPARLYERTLIPQDAAWWHHFTRNALAVGLALLLAILTITITAAAIAGTDAKILSLVGQLTITPCAGSPRRSAPIRSSKGCAAPRSNRNVPARCQTPSSPGCSPAPTCAQRSASGTARSSNSSRARGLRRSELARLTLADIQERGRQPDKRRRAAIAPKRSDQTPLEVIVRGSERGRTRTIPLHAEAHDALRRWYTARPAAATDALFVSLRARRAESPEPISGGAVGDIVMRHATAAGVRDDRRTAHALRHTFCTMLAERGVALEVIRALAGHIDIRTTQIYVDVTDQRKADGIAALERKRHPLAA